MCSGGTASNVLLWGVGGGRQKRECREGSREVRKEGKQESLLFCHLIHLLGLSI